MTKKIAKLIRKKKKKKSWIFPGELQGLMFNNESVDGEEVAQKGIDRLATTTITQTHPLQTHICMCCTITNEPERAFTWLKSSTIPGLL